MTDLGVVALCAVPAVLVAADRCGGHVHGTATTRAGRTIAAGPEFRHFDLRHNNQITSYTRLV